MNKLKVLVPILIVALLSSCGSGQPERVKADSSVTSASVGSVQLPAAINTDTTSAAPVPLNDTVKQTDTQTVNFPDAAKEPGNGSTKSKSD